MVAPRVSSLRLPWWIGGSEFVAEDADMAEWAGKVSVVRALTACETQQSPI